MSKPDTWYSTGQPQATLESEFLASLSKNQKVIWNGRANPLTVVGESFGSHVMVEGQTVLSTGLNLMVKAISG